MGGPPRSGAGFQGVVYWCDSFAGMLVHLRVALRRLCFFVLFPLYELEITTPKSVQDLEDSVGCWAEGAGSVAFHTVFVVFVCLDCV